MVITVHFRLPQEDLEALRRLAGEEGVSMSALVRDAVKKMLEARRKPSREELWERASKVIGKYRSGVPDLGERHDDYLAEALEEEAKRWRFS